MATAKKLPSGNWRVRIYIGSDANGKAKYKSFTAETKKEAEFLAAQYNQLKIEVNSNDMLLRTAVEKYISSKENIVSPSTIKGYRAIMRNDVQELMNTRIRDITSEQVQIALNEFAADHAPKTCRNVHGLISAVLKTYRPEINLNTTLPQKKKRDIYVPDENEVKQLMELVKDTKLEIPFLLATQCGLRASEISGLEVSSVFPDHIEIKQARVQGESGAVLKSPKSYAGFRSVPIIPQFSEFLIKHAVDNRICPYTSDQISNNWRHFKETNKLPIFLNFHALRHYFPSRCLLMGMPQKYIAEIMGHSSINMIEKVYQHTFPSAMAMYAQKIREQMLNILTNSL